MLGIGAAVAAIMWAYDGWGNVTVVAEEVRNPQRNVPLALIVGVLILIVLYTGANLAYHLTLPSSEIIATPITARPSAVCERLLPNFGAKLMQAMIMVSVFGALNANVLVGPRVLFAVARDHRIPRSLQPHSSADAHAGLGDCRHVRLVLRLDPDGRAELGSQRATVRHDERMDRVRRLDLLFLRRGGGVRAARSAARRSDGPIAPGAIRSCPRFFSCSMYSCWSACFRRGRWID